MIDFKYDKSRFTFHPYEGLAERQTKILEAESKGLRMLHDNFDDPKWKHGDPQIGTMTFTDEPEPIVIVEPARDLAKELDELKADIKAIKGKLII